MRRKAKIDRWHEATPDGTVIHCGPAVGGDSTLCGFAMEGERGDHPLAAVMLGKINCPSCVAIIRFCKAVPAAFLKT
ncbi:MAG: hypothetical protein JWQ94_4275 [Tardiphaga sp.]|nr:hypothetical protein [Tardiphaga sp.]